MTVTDYIAPWLAAIIIATAWTTLAVQSYVQAQRARVKSSREARRG
jgi:hypothetical protein